jgi:hypothetical protein
MRKYFVIILAILAPLLILYFYYIYNEAESSWSVQCSLYQMTGLQCPGCGGQRALHYLLHGELLKAFRYNAIFVLTLPILIYIYFVIVNVYGLKNTKYINTPLLGQYFGIITIIVLIVFFILRNIPCFPFTYLSPPI